MSDSPRTARPLRAAAALSLVALLLAGCVPDSGGVPGRLERGLASADSSAQTALLALRELRAGRTTSQHAETAVDDALTKLGEEQTTLASIEPTTRTERDWRRRADAAIASVDAALKDARSAASGEAGIRWSTASRELENASRALDRATRSLVRQAGDRE